MKKLKNKVYITIFTILTLSILTILLIFNIQNYQEKRNTVINSLNRMDNNIPKEKLKDDKPRKEINEVEVNEYENRKFIDTKIYTVLLDSDKNIKDIINHFDDDNTEIIKKQAQKILNSNKKNKLYVGNLYLNKYSFKYNDNSIIIIDNTDINKNLINSLKNTILIFIMLEIIMSWLSYYLTKYLTKPVIDSFNKQKQFIADASHELKTPLSVIMASADAIDDKNNKWINNIKSESDRMNNLIKDLLELARLENMNNKIYEIYDLSKLVEMTSLTYESLMYEKSIKLKYDIEPNIKFKCSKDEIKQLLGILIDNAIKHSIEKGTVTIKLKSKKDIVLTVENIGKPIKKGDENKIFERFYRSDESRNRNENRYGLGLAIAKNIVTNYKGNISAKSLNDKTIFTVILKK